MPANESSARPVLELCAQPAERRYFAGSPLGLSGPRPLLRQEVRRDDGSGKEGEEHDPVEGFAH